MKIQLSNITKYQFYIENNDEDNDLTERSCVNFLDKKINAYSSAWAKETTDVFYQSVHSIDSSIYSVEQKNAWAPLPIDYDKWQKRLVLKKPTLLLINEQIAGFIELESNGHIDCTYVSPNFQKIGVASTLLEYVIKLARHSGIDHLYVEASIVAKPLFEKFGFVTENENKVIRKKVVLVNYSMHLKI